MGGERRDYDVEGRGEGVRRGKAGEREDGEELGR